MDADRRALLARLLSAGWIASAPGLARAGDAVPPRLSAGRSIHQLRGEVLVNGALARSDTRIGPGDSVTTGPGGELVVAIGTDAFMLREHSQVEFDLGAGARAGLRLLSGAVLAVFGPRRDEDALELRTPVATIGIRGTGVYVEHDHAGSYVCTCYGAVAIAARDASGAAEQVRSRHHDAPRWIGATGSAPAPTGAAPMRGHDDHELVMLEALVGRQVPFAPASTTPPSPPMSQPPADQESP